MEPRLKYKKNRTVNRWRRLASEILQNNFILAWNHGLTDGRKSSFTRREEFGEEYPDSGKCGRRRHGDTV